MGMKTLAGLRMALQLHRKGKNKPVKEITTRFWAYAGTPVRRKSARPTGNWLKSGIQITSKTMTTRKKLRRNSWTLPLPKKFCLTKKCVRNSIKVKIRWTLKRNENVKGMEILSKDFIDRVETHLEADTNSSSFISIDTLFFICYVLRSFGIHIITKHSWLVGLLVGFWCR